MNFKDKVRFDSEKYRSAFKQYGDSPKSLLWWDGETDRRKIRYFELLKHLHLSADAALLDVGCGFGDLYQFCIDYFDIKLDYTGIDYCTEFIEAAKKKHSGRCALIQGDFLRAPDMGRYDYCVTSGIFNISNGEDDNVEDGYLYSVVRKMFELCDIAISFNFVTDKVDYKNAGVSYYTPAKILDFCYSLSRNIVFDNSCMPFEATVTVFKDDSFSKARVFNFFERVHLRELQGGIFTADKKEREETVDSQNILVKGQPLHSYITAEDGKRAMEMVLAVCRSAADGNTERFPLEYCSSMDFTGDRNQRFISKRRVVI